MATLLSIGVELWELGGVKTVIAFTPEGGLAPLVRFRLNTAEILVSAITIIF